MNALEQLLVYPLGDALPAQGETLEVAPGVKLDPHGPAIRPGPHQPVAAARRDRRPRRLDRGGLLHQPRRGQGPVGADFRDAAGGPADPARDRDSHAPRPHRPGLVAVRALERAAVDQRDRLQRGATRVAEHHRLRRRTRRQLLCLARPHRSGVGGEDPGPDQLLPEHGAAGPAHVPAHAGRRHGSHRRARLALHQRLRPRARTHRAVLRSAEGADQRRHDAAAHLDQRQRLRRGAGVQPAARPSSTPSTSLPACRRTP